MPTEYKETAISGSKYKRCNNINIANPKGKPPFIYFTEEDIINIGDEIITKSSGNFGFEANDPTKTIDLMNPMTYEKTGSTITIGEIYAIIFSVYWHLARERDLKNE